MVCLEEGEEGLALVKAGGRVAWVIDTQFIAVECGGWQRGS